MAVFKVALSLLKKQKAYGITIFALSLLVALMLSAALTVIKQGENTFDLAWDEANCGDMLYIVWAEDWNFDYFRRSNAVESIHETNAVSFMPKELDFGGHTATDLYFLPYEPLANPYKILSHDGTFPLKEGEVLLPLTHERQYSLNIGDVVTIRGQSFTVAGFYEDPVYGSAVMGIKRVLLHQRDLEALYENNIYKMRFVSITLKDSTEDMQHLHEGFLAAMDESAAFNLNWKASIMGFSMMLPNLVAAGLAALAALALLIAFLVLRYAVLSSIDGNFVTLGAFKALGFTGGQIRFAILLQYMTVCLTGVVVGGLISLPVIPLAGGLVMSAAGLLWRGGWWWVAGVGVVASLTLLMALLVWGNTRKIRKISPVRAISFGRAPVYFAHRLNIPLGKLSILPLHLRMAIKQMMTRRKQYAVLVLVSVLLTFLMTFMGTFSIMLDSEQGFYSLLGFPIADILYGTSNTGEETIALFHEILGEIRENYDISVEFEMTFLWLDVEGKGTRINVYSRFEGIGFPAPLKGRFPIYDNEIALAPTVSKALGKTVGDIVTVSGSDGYQAEYIVSGIMQSANEMGNCATMSAEAAKLFNDDSFPITAFIFAVGTDTEAVRTELKETYQTEDSIDFVTFDDMLGGISGSARSIVRPAALASYTLTFVLVSLITFLLAIIALHRENTDFGIFKSTGFTSRQLRLQFALRFGLVSMTGGVAGLLLALLGSDTLISFIFGFFGVPKVHMSFTPPDLLLPLALVFAIALLSSWLVSRRIKKVSIRTLITE